MSLDSNQLDNKSRLEKLQMSLDLNEIKQHENKSDNKTNVRTSTCILVMCIVQLVLLAIFLGCILYKLSVKKYI